MMTVHFDLVRASKNSEYDLNTMFNQGYKQLYDIGRVLFRCSDDRLWRAQYRFMQSTSQGGLDWNSNYYIHLFRCLQLIVPIVYFVSE
jgi:hypothetical protein